MTTETITYTKPTDEGPDWVLRESDGWLPRGPYTPPPGSTWDLLPVVLA